MTKFATYSATLAFLLFSLTGSLRAGPDDTLGMALLSATVAANGTLVTGSGAMSVTRMPSGIYDITFDRDLSACSCTASLGEHNNSIAYGGSVSITSNCPSASSNNVARIMTVIGGSSADAPFHLIVFCPK